MDQPQLRPWQESDFEGFAAMNADPEVMRHLPAPLAREQSRTVCERLRATLEQRGWGIWAVDVVGGFAGMVGLSVPRRELPFSPCVEVLWRLRREFWGQGIAHAAAAEAVNRGFSQADLSEIVAFTTPPNSRSLRLVERLGFRRDHAGDLDHPGAPPRPPDAAPCALP